MGKQRLEKYQAKRKAQLDLDARQGRNKFGLARSTAPRSNMKGNVQRANVIGFTVNSKGNSVISSRIYRTPSVNGHPLSSPLLGNEDMQVSDLFMPRDTLPIAVIEGKRAMRAITPSFGRDGPSLYDTCVLSKAWWHPRYAMQGAMVHERSGRHEGRNRHVYSEGHAPITHTRKAEYHWPSGTLPPMQYVDVRAKDRDRLADYLSLYHLARTEAAALVSDVWPWPVDWNEGAPSIS